MITSLFRKRKIEDLEEQDQGQVKKMPRIEEIDSVQDNSVPVVKKYDETSAKVVLAKYNLNDLNALENKYAMCNVTPIKVSKEAKDGSSIHVDMKTSLFETVKRNLIQVLNEDPNIEKAITSRVTKAKSNC